MNRADALRDTLAEQRMAIVDPFTLALESTPRALVTRFASAGESLRRAIDGLSDEGLKRRWNLSDGVGEWSVQEVVLHLADASTAFVDRIKRILAQPEAEPLLLEWSENDYVEKLMYDEQSAEDAVTILDLSQKQVARVLNLIDETDFDRAGRHSSRGSQTLKDVLAYAVWHVDHHVAFIEKKRAKLKQ